MKKSFSVIVIAALLLGGCSKSELANQEPSGALIQAKSAFPGVSGEATRVPYTGDISSENPLVARVLTSRTSGNYTTTHANGKMTFGGSAAVGYDPTAVTGSASFDSDDAEPYYLAGLYPYDATFGATVTSTAARSLDGKTDVMAAAEVETNYATTITNKNPPTLTFKHLLTKLEVNVKAKADGSKLKWGKINTIELTAIDAASIKNNITVTLETGTAAAAAFSGSASSFPFYSIDNEGKYTDTKFANAGIELATTAKLVAYSLIAPFTNVVGGATPTKLTFNIVPEKGDAVDVDVSLPVAGYTQGRAYSITFTFDAVADAIQSKATVIEWDDSGSADVDVTNN
jgi:hypothetical protein